MQNKPDLTMDSLRNSLCLFNWNLLVGGSPIFIPNIRGLAFLLRIHGVILIIVYLYLSTSSALDVAVPSKSPAIIYYMMRTWEAAHDIFAVTAIIVMWMSRGRLMQVLEKLCKVLNEQDRKDLRRMSILCILFRLIELIFIEVFFLFVLFRSNLLKGCSFFDVTHFFILYIQTDNWTFKIVSFLIVMLRVIHMAEQNSLKCLKEDLWRLHPSKVYKEIQDNIQLKDEFMSIVSILPCTLFLYLFVAAVCTIARLQVTTLDSSISKEELLYAKLAIGRVLLAVLEVAFVSFYTNSVCLESQRTLESLETDIIVNQDALHWLYVLVKIKEAKEYEYKAFHFFAINKQLLLSFLSAFVTFTVLFVQLINQGIQMNQ